MTSRKTYCVERTPRPPGAGRQPGVDHVLPQAGRPRAEARDPVDDIDHPSWRDPDLRDASQAPGEKNVGDPGWHPAVYPPGERGVSAPKRGNTVWVVT